MKTLLIAGALALASLPLCACASFSGADLTNAVNALAAAGCSGTIEDTVTAATAAGVSPGSATFSHKFSGSCDASKAKAAAATPAANP